MLRKLDEWMGGLSNSNILPLKKKTILNRYRHSYRHRYRHTFKSNNLYLCLSLSLPPSRSRYIFLTWDSGLCLLEELYYTRKWVTHIYPFIQVLKLYSSVEIQILKPDYILERFRAGGYLKDSLTPHNFSEGSLREAAFCVNPDLFLMIHPGSSGLGMKPRPLTSYPGLFLLNHIPSQESFYFLTNITTLLQQAREDQSPSLLVVVVLVGLMGWRFTFIVFTPQARQHYKFNSHNWSYFFPFKNMISVFKVITLYYS